ncbi:MAG: inositol monophosphatase family protein [Pseudomonadota bacterium]
MASLDVEAELALCGALADEARRAVATRFRAGLIADNKLGGRAFDPVTEADRAIEAAISARLDAERPEDGRLGEEGASQDSRSGRTWVIDPIDGTRAFIAGLPTWCVLIALCDETGPILSVIDQPVTGERFLGLDAGARKGAWLERGGQREAISVSAEPDLVRAIGTTTDPYLFEAAERGAFEGVRDQARLVRYGLDAYGYAALAMGGLHFVVESGLKVWDIAALTPVVRGAGGVMTSWTGGDCHEGGHVLASSDPALHEALLTRLAPAASR